MTTARTLHARYNTTKSYNPNTTPPTPGKQHQQHATTTK